MLASTFQSNLRKLNPKLKIFCGDDDTKPAGLYIIRRGIYGEDLGGSYDQICSVDKNWVPEYSEFATNGAIIKGGWRRVLRILISQGLVDKRKAEKVFRTDLNYRRPKPAKQNTAVETAKKLAEYAQEINSWVQKRG